MVTLPHLEGITMFSLNDKVVYPGHGVARINQILEKRVAGQQTQFFELTFLNKDMTILVPTANLSSVGIRRLSSDQSIDELFKLLALPTKSPSIDQVTNNWNKRNKEYQNKLRTGNLQEICAIYRDLQNISLQKELSFGEKNLLLQTEELLAQEISLVKEVEEDKAVEQLRSLFKVGSCRPLAFAQKL